MTTINEQIVASTDDCYETNDSSIITSGFTMVVGVAMGNVHDIGLRWQSVNIANAATVSAATLSLYLAADNGTLQATAKGIAEDNTATWSSGSRPSQRSKVGSVSANEADWGNWAVGNWVTLNVTSIIQSIVNRAGWSANNALAIVVEGAGSGETDYDEVRAYNYPGNAHGAKLDITHTSGRGTKNTRSTINVHSGVLFHTLTSGHGY